MKPGRTSLIALLSLAVMACQQVPVENASSDERAAVRTRLAAEYFKRNQYGVAMEESGVSKIVSVRLEQVAQDGKITV